MLSSSFRKVYWKQIIEGHSSVSNSGNSIFAFNPRNSTGLFLDPWLIEFMFCHLAVFVWLVCWFLIVFQLYPLLLVLRIYLVSGLVLFFLDVHSFWLGIFPLDFWLVSTVDWLGLIDFRPGLFSLDVQYSPMVFHYLFLYFLGGGGSIRLGGRDLDAFFLS